jgi:hypothetical protein
MKPRQSGFVAAEARNASAVLLVVVAGVGKVPASVSPGGFARVDALLEKLAA